MINEALKELKRDAFSFALLLQNGGKGLSLQSRFRKTGEESPCAAAVRDCAIAAAWRVFPFCQERFPCFPANLARVRFSGKRKEESRG